MRMTMIVAVVVMMSMIFTCTFRTHDHENLILIQLLDPALESSKLICLF